MTVHLTGTAPMGEDAGVAAVDSFGRLHGMDNVQVNDASTLPWAPGVNPQGTLMAVAHRNVEAFLERRGVSMSPTMPARARDRRPAPLADFDRPSGGVRRDGPARAPELTIVTGASGWFGRAYLAAIAAADGADADGDAGADDVDGGPGRRSPGQVRCGSWSARRRTSRRA